MFFSKKRRRYEWRKEWQEKLSHILEENSKRFKASLVFVAAEESDPYSELLFLFSFIGVSFGSFLGLALKIFKIDFGIDLYVFPLLGFTGFGLFHTRKSFWLRRFFRNLAEKRVSQRARSCFYDYHTNPVSPLVLIYVAESEHRLEILRSPTLIQQLSPGRMEELKQSFAEEYDPKDPLKFIEKMIASIGSWLQDSQESPESGEAEATGDNPAFIPAADFEITFVPILKGNKDIN